MTLNEIRRVILSEYGLTYFDTQASGQHSDLFADDEDFVADLLYSIEEQGLLPEAAPEVIRIATWSLLDEAHTIAAVGGVLS
jgi:hypothetical protein